MGSETTIGTGKTGRTTGSLPQRRAAEAALPDAPLARDTVTSSHQYVVQDGDALYKLARRFNVSYEALLAANPQITSGPRRTPAGDLIYVGEKLNIPARGSEGQDLREKVRAAQEENARLQAEIERAKAEGEQNRAALQGDLDQARGDLDQTRGQLDQTQADLAATKAEAAWRKQIQDAKSEIGQMPGPEGWQSAAHAEGLITRAQQLLGGIPKEDADYGRLAAQVDQAKKTYDAARSSVADLTSGRDTIKGKEIDELGREVETTKPRELDDETRALGGAAFAVASPEEKAKLILNMYKGFTSDDDQAKIMEALQVAKRQGQLQKTLEAMDQVKVRMLLGKSTLLKELPGVMSAERLDQLEALAREAGSKTLQERVETARERKQAANQSY